MRPFSYNDGQRAVQREANTVPCADKLSTWVGPVVQFATIADLVVLASADSGGFSVVALSGPPPLLDAREAAETIALRLPRGVLQHLPVDHPCGGIVINPAEARRSRVAGVLRDWDAAAELTCTVAFTNCRKYMAPTASLGAGTHVGPVSRTPLPLTDPWVATTTAAAETAFLVTTTPDGVGDVSHRGGVPGFLHYDAAQSRLAWTEYLGDGMFVSTGNLRQASRFALIVLEFSSGDALRFDGTAAYENVRTDRHARVDALLQEGEAFPVQGRMECRIETAERLVRFCHPRTRITHRQRVHSADTIATQHP